MERLYRKINGGKDMPREMLEYQKLIGRHFNFRREPIPLFQDAELKKLTMPSQVFVGRNDVMFHSLKTAERYGKLVPNGRVTVLQGAGHALTGLADDILAFLKQCSGAGHPKKANLEKRRFCPALAHSLDDLQFVLLVPRPTSSSFSSCT